MTNKRKNQRNVWVDIDFAETLKEIAREKSLKDKKDYGCGDISRIMVKLPQFKELKNVILNSENEIIAHIKLKMDGRKFL